MCKSCIEKKIYRSKYPFTRKTRPNCNPRLIQLSYRYIGIFCWIVDTIVPIYSTWKFKMSFVGPRNFINDVIALSLVIQNHFAELYTAIRIIL